MACVISVADYGSQIWGMNQKGKTTTKALQSIQNSAIKKILGVFRTAPTLPCEVEANLPPPPLRVERTCRMYALRLKKLQRSHPVRSLDALEGLGLEMPTSDIQPTTRLQRLKALQTDTLPDPQPLHPPWENRSSQITNLVHSKAKASINQHIQTKWISLLQGTRPSTTNRRSYTRIFPWTLQKSQVSGPRAITSAFYQLKLGHGYLKSYLHRLDKTSNDKCRCGAPETAEHLLLNCSDYNQERQALRKALRHLKLPLSLPLLFTKEGTKDTLDFIQKTGIATRKWHLQRREEEEEEENV
jgi:hypothetical protein